jgi:hemolysin activation/secretion protein
LPYLLRIPVQAEGEVDFLKQESAFLNLNAQAAAAYVFSPYLSARFYYRSRSSRLLDAALADTAAQPAQLDARRQTAGAGLVYENLDYRTSPTRGLSARLEIGLGSRQIRPNVRLPEALYDTLDLSEPIRELALDIRLYRRVRPRQVLYLGHQSRWLGMQQYYRNDQFQLGGARSVRGFNENQFFADLYLSWTAEYRLLLAQDSYLFVLGDYAWLRDQVQDTRHHLTGAGLGFTWATRAGLLSLTYATGRTEESAFQPARGRIHIGFINEF